MNGNVHMLTIRSYNPSICSAVGTREILVENLFLCMLGSTKNYHYGYQDSIRSSLHPDRHHNIFRLE